MHLVLPFFFSSLLSRPTMKASSVLQTSRLANRARSKETPPSQRSDPNSGNGKSHKIVPKRLSWEFSDSPEEIPSDPLDSVGLSPEMMSTVEDPAEMVSPIFVSFKMDEHAVMGSGKLTGGCTDSDAVKEEEKERALVVIDRVREALLEISASDLSNETKRAVEALVEIVIGDPGVDTRARDGFPDHVFRANVRIGILLFLIWLVMVIYTLVATTIWFVRGREEALAGPPPT
ncbi:uncharacterized protein [Elaeis guineensis]|uniref:uncharacterized protein n=1 Tax=Elaeis guineensis var. tenera TaxID=51953 RepID=UPI00095016DC